MFKSNSVIAYLIIFLALTLLLKFLGIINITYYELAGYVLIFYGVGIVYTSMGLNKKISLFLGVILFFTGLLIFVINNYDITKFSNIVLPSIFFILGAGFLVLFIDDYDNKLLAVISVIFFISGIFFFLKLGTFSFSDFIKSILSIITKYWPLVLIITAIIVLLNKKQRS